MLNLRVVLLIMMVVAMNEQVEFMIVQENVMAMLWRTAQENVVVMHNTMIVEYVMVIIRVVLGAQIL